MKKMDMSPTIRWNPFSPGYFTDPYPHLKACREATPVQQSSTDSFFLFGYKEVDEVIRNRNFEVVDMCDYLIQKEPYIFSGQPAGCPFLGRVTKFWPLYLNGDLHKRVRRAVTLAVTRLGTPEAMTDALERTLSAFRDKTAFDLTDCCGYFNFIFLRSMLGFREDFEFTAVKRLSSLLTTMLDFYVPKQAYLAAEEAMQLSRPFFGESEFARIVREDMHDLALSDDECYSIMLVALFASFENSTANFAMSLREILPDRALTEYVLAADADRRKVLVEELLRFNCTTQYTIRYNDVPIELGGIEVPARSRLQLCLASANRDPLVFDRPDEILPERQHNPHLSFGAGIHLCLGGATARREMASVLAPMVDFLKDCDIGPARFERKILLHIPEYIPVRRRPA
ncbi:MAG: hypothetical protein RLY31_1924 [Bacteroidota bacterium]